MQKQLQTESRGSLIKRMLDSLFDVTGVKPSSTSTGVTGPTSGGSSSSSAVTGMADMWKTYNDRKSVYNDINRMETQDELVTKSADIIADNAAAFDATTERRITLTSKNDQVLDILGRCNERLDLENDIWQIARDTFMQGSSFRENVIEQSPAGKNAMYVRLFKQTVPYQIFPNTNDKGEKIPGWWYRTDQDIFSNKKGILMQEWQITPFLFGTRRGYFAMPPLTAARRNWNRLSLLEDGMAIARQVRAYDRLVHRIPVEKNWTEDMITSTIRGYKDVITKRKMSSGLDGSGSQVSQTDSPFTAATDFYLPDDGTNRGGVETLSSANNQLLNLTDVYYSRERLLAILSVPITYLQIMSTQKTHLRAAGSSMSDAEKQFAMMIRRLQAVVRRGTMRVYDLELMLNNIVPIPGLYDMQLTKINTLDLKANADIELTNAQAAIYFLEAFGSLPLELVANKFFSMSPGQQEIMQKFLDANAAKIEAARVKAIQNNAVLPLTPGQGQKSTSTNTKGGNNGGSGSGNSNKSRVARSKEQQGYDTGDDLISIDDAVDVFATLSNLVNADLQRAGIKTVQVDESYVSIIRQNLIDIALAGQPIL